MKLATKTAAIALSAAVLTSAAACGSGHPVHYANSSFCIDQVGRVVSPAYCTVGGIGYVPGLYDYWVGPTYGHTYAVGTVINHNYFTKGKQVSPTDPTARKKAGLPATGGIKTGASTVKKTGSAAKSQTGPASPSKGTGVSGGTKSNSTTPKSSTTKPKSSTGVSGGGSSKSSTTGKSSTGFSGGRSSGSSPSGGSSSRSSSGSSSSTGRK